MPRVNAGTGINIYVCLNRSIDFEGVIVFSRVWLNRREKTPLECELYTFCDVSDIINSIVTL